MQYLEDNEMEDFILIKDDEIREWWQQHKIADRQAAINEIKRLEEAVDGTRLAKKGLERDIKKQEKALQKAKDELAKRK
jgi:hypothetical protein